MLSQRHNIVLSSIVEHYISSVEPIGSKFLSYKLNLGLSPATIRNVMAELEEVGLITHPHTSAGRLPTTAGYKYYVNELMKKKRLSRKERELIYSSLAENIDDPESFLATTSRLLANITNQLSFLTLTILEDSSFEKLDVIQLSSNRIMVVIFVNSGILKSLYIELNDSINPNELQTASKILNERLHGMKLNEIRQSFRTIIQDVPVDKNSILKVFLKRYQDLFSSDNLMNLIVKGTKNLLLQPEFKDNPNLSEVLDYIEEKQKFKDLVETNIQSNNKSVIFIGDDIPIPPMKECSVVMSQFKFGTEIGQIGIIGPQRMNYSNILAFVEYTASVISDLIKNN